jgi:hypothetical protein
MRHNCGPQTKNYPGLATADRRATVNLFRFEPPIAAAAFSLSETIALI